ncbi:MAG: hypothetical protein ACE5R6_16720 [Candidatus Heimdallarchaeota archaeon]
MGDHFRDWNSGVLKETHIEGKYDVWGELEPTEPDFEPHRVQEETDAFESLTENTDPDM